MGELFADFLSVISEIFSWKPFKINYIFSCSKNVPTSARRTFSMKIHYKQKRFSRPTENQSIKGSEKHQC